MNRIKNTQNLCKWFRVEILKLTLAELVEGTDTKLGTVSAFENSRSNNLNHIFIYMDKADAKQKEIFMEHFTNNLLG